MPATNIKPHYKSLLARWQNGNATIRQVELLVKTKWLTVEEADRIYKNPRKPTKLIEKDIYTPARVAAIRQNLNAGE